MKKRMFATIIAVLAVISLSILPAFAVEANVKEITTSYTGNSSVSFRIRSTEFDTVLFSGNNSSFSGRLSLSNAANIKTVAFASPDSAIFVNGAYNLKLEAVQSVSEYSIQKFNPVSNSLILEGEGDILITSAAGDAVLTVSDIQLGNSKERLVLGKGVKLSITDKSVYENFVVYDNSKNEVEAIDAAGNFSVVSDDSYIIIQKAGTQATDFVALGGTVPAETTTSPFREVTTTAPELGTTVSSGSFGVIIAVIAVAAVGAAAAIIINKKKKAA